MSRGLTGVPLGVGAVGTDGAVVAAPLLMFAALLGDG